jgi:integrase
MSLFKRGEVYWFEFEFRGQRVRESTHSTSRTLAVRAERQRRREFEEGTNGLQAARKPKLFAAASRDWLDTNRARWSKSNAAIQAYNLAHLVPFFGSMLLSDISAEHIGRYQSFRQSQPLPEKQAKKSAASTDKRQRKTSNRTINMEVSTLRMILKAHKLWSRISDEVGMLPERRRIGKALSQAEKDRLLAACLKSAQPSLYTAVTVFINTALRNSELRCARWHQVDFLKAEFQVGEAKTEGSEDRVVPLNKSALAALTEWRSRWPEAKPTDYIFPTEKLVFKGQGTADQGIMTSYDADPTKPLGSWKRAWATATKQAKVTARIHDLRHHAITVLAESQTPDATIQAISGHLSSKMLKHYSHVRKAATRLAVDALDSFNESAVQ